MRPNRLTNKIWDVTISKAAKTADTPSTTYILRVQSQYGKIPCRIDHRRRRRRVGVAAVSFSLWGRNFLTEIEDGARSATSIERRRPVRHTRAASDDKSRVQAPGRYSPDNGAVLSSIHYNTTLTNISSPLLCLPLKMMADAAPITPKNGP